MRKSIFKILKSQYIVDKIEISILYVENFRFYTAGHVGGWLIVTENLKFLFQVVSHWIIAKATPIR